MLGDWIWVLCDLASFSRNLDQCFPVLIYLLNMLHRSAYPVMGIFGLFCLFFLLLCTYPYYVKEMVANLLVILLPPFSSRPNIGISR